MSKKKVFKKKLEDFIKDESGNMTRDKVLKIGLGTISALGILSSLSSTAEAITNYKSHENNVIKLAQACCHNSHASHVNHSSY